LEARCDLKAASSVAKKRSGLSSSEVMSHWSRAIDFAKAARFGIDDDRIFGVSFFLGFFIISLPLWSLRHVFRRFCHDDTGLK
jgi:hypothetical protein